MQSVCDLAALSASQLLTFTLSFSSSSPLCFTHCYCLSSALRHFSFACFSLPLLDSLLSVHSFHPSLCISSSWSFSLFFSILFLSVLPTSQISRPPSRSPPPPFLKSVWSPLIPSAPGVVVLGWMSALRIRGLKRAEQQPKPWNPLNLSFSLSCFNWHC